MYFRGLIPRNFAQLAEAVPIGACSSFIEMPTMAVLTNISENLVLLYRSKYFCIINVKSVVLIFNFRFRKIA